MRHRLLISTITLPPHSVHEHTNYLNWILLIYLIIIEIYSPKKVYERDERQSCDDRSSSSAARSHQSLKFGILSLMRVFLPFRVFGISQEFHCEALHELPHLFLEEDFIDVVRNEMSIKCVCAQKLQYVWEKPQCVLARPKWEKRVKSTPTLNESVKHPIPY